MTDSNRNALAAMIIMKKGLLRADQLIDTIESCPQDSDLELASVLLQQQKITQADADEISQLVDQCKSSPDVAETLASDDAAGTGRSDSTFIKTQFTSADNNSNNQNELSRYRFLRPHAKGGLGEVAVALDSELNREVALKTIQQRHADDNSSQARFTLEAKVTGSLEHPGIVPVYGFGVDATGKPYYAMRFIHGDSLKEAIDQQFSSDSPSSTPSSPLQFRRLLRAIIDACHAIEYAHNRGVIHRDIKPANIMLGEYGETLVVDWGLAKFVDSQSDGGEANSLKTQEHAASDPHAATLYGMVIGTPAYMSPEQAAGKLDSLGPASDIYSLGATLYCVLSGEAPFSGSDVKSTLADVIAGNVKSPRDQRSHVAKELNAICMKAMATDAADRYSSPKELANDLENWLADEPVSVYRESLPERSWRWLRQHRSLALTSLVACILVALTSGIAAFVVNEFRAVARVAEAQAITDRNSAERSRDEAQAISDFLVDALASPDPKNEGVSVTVADVLRNATAKLDQKFNDQPLTKAAMLHAIARAQRGLGELDEAKVLAEQSLELRQQHLGDEHESTWLSLTNLAVIENYRRQNPERAIQLAQKAFDIATKLFGPEHERTLTAKLNYGLTLSKGNRLKEAIPIERELVKQCESLLGTENRLTLNAKHNLAGALMLAEQYESALETLEPVVQERTRVFGDSYYETLRSRTLLADIYLKVSETNQDEAAKMRAREIYRTLVILRTSELGAAHRETLMNLWSLAELEFEIYEVDASPPPGTSLKTLYPRILKLYPQQPIDSVDFFATLLRINGQVDKARDLYRNSFAKDHERLSDGENAARLESMVSFFEDNEYADDLIWALRIQEELLLRLDGVYSEDVRRARFQLASVLYYEKRFEELSNIAPPFILQFAKQAKPQNLMVLCAMHATALNELKQYNAAEELIRKYLENGERNASGFWGVGECKVQLGRALLNQERYAEAEPLLVRGNLQMRSMRSQMDPRMRHIKPIAKSFNYIIELFKRQGKTDLQEKWMSYSEEFFAE